MAEEDQVEENENAEGEEEEGKSGKKKLILILLPLLLIGGGGGAAYYLGYLDSLLGVEPAMECEMVEDDHGEMVEECVEVEAEHGDEHGDGHGDEHGDDHASDGHGDDHGDGHGDEHGSVETAFLAIPPMVLNLNTNDGTDRYLRLTIQLELAHPEEKPQVEAVMPRVIAQLQTYLRELRVQDLRGSAGIYRLQMELLWRVNKAVAPVEVKDVLFQEILIQ